MFIIRVLKDLRNVKKKRDEDDEAHMKEFSDISKFQNTPLYKWSQDEVLRWIKIGAMHEPDYFSEAKRLSISEKFEAACVDGKLLYDYGSDIDKLVQYIGLPFGDAVKLSKEFKQLEKESKDLQAETALVLTNR